MIDRREALESSVIDQLDGTLRCVASSRCLRLDALRLDNSDASLRLVVRKIANGQCAEITLARVVKGLEENGRELIQLLGELKVCF